MPDEYDPRLSEGIRLFNEREFFECHDVLEDLWNDIPGSDREFYQGLIHAAVACFHFENGNLGGARKMYSSCQGYLTPYAPRFMGLNVEQFLADLSICFHELRTATSGTYPSGLQMDLSLVPIMNPAESGS